MSGNGYHVLGWNEDDTGEEREEAEENEDCSGESEDDSGRARRKGIV